MQAHSFIVIVYKFSNSNANVYIILFWLNYINDQDYYWFVGCFWLNDIKKNQLLEVRDFCINKI